MVNQRNLGRILFTIKEQQTIPRPDPPVEDEVPLEISMLKTILLPVFESELKYYFVNDIKADDEHKKYYKIKDFPNRGTSLEYILSYKEYYNLTLKNFIFELEESDKRIDYTFTITDYPCIFKNEVAGSIVVGESETVDYYKPIYSNYGYKGNNEITDENNGTIHHVRFITNPTEPSEDYDPSEDVNNVYEAFNDEQLTYGDYGYLVQDDGSQRKIIIYYDTTKGQTEESAKNADVDIFVKKVNINDLGDIPQKGTNDYYYMFYAYEIIYDNIINKSSNQESSNTEPTNTEQTNQEPTNTEPTNNEPTNTEPTNNEPTNP